MRWLKCKRIYLLFSLVLLMFTSSLERGFAQSSSPAVVFAAASLQESLNAAADAYAALGHPRPVLSFAASSTVARQIENGAPANLFISADEQWMDYVQAAHLVVPKSRVDFLGNRLVLIAPAVRPIKIEIKKGAPLEKILGEEKLAMADPDSVPAGRYAKAALMNLKIWQKVEARIVRAENVRAAMAFVERDEVRAGIVYETDAKASSKVVVAGVFPASSYPPIRYPIAIMEGKQTPEAVKFYAFLLSPKGRSIFNRFGFLSLQK